MLLPTLDDDVFVTGLEAVELSTKRTLWSIVLETAVCGLGQPGAVSCAEGDQITTYDLRSGSIVRRITAPHPPAEIVGLSDGGVVIASWPASAQGSSMSGTANATLPVSLARLESSGSTRWTHSLSLQSAGQSALLGVSGNNLLVSTWVYLKAPSVPTTHSYPLLTTVRSLETGDPVPSIPDGSLVERVPGDKLLVRAAAADKVVDDAGHLLATLSPTLHPSLFRPANDGTVPGYWGTAVPTGASPSETVLLFGDGGRLVATLPDERPIAACGEVCVTGVQDAAGKDTGVRIARDSAGTEKWRTALPAGNGALGLCDGTRIIESVISPDGAAEIVAYSGAGVAWRHALGRTQDERWFLAPAWSEGILLYRRPEPTLGHRLDIRLLR